MAYTLKHPVWFPNRPSCGVNDLGISPSSKFIYKDNELETYMSSATMMSIALLKVSNQITENSAQLIARRNSDESYTDGKHIVVGMNPVNIHKDKHEAMDVLMGLACHESCHCAYTDFEDYGLEKVMKYQIGKWLSNVYEDECIEEMLGLRHKQWMYFLDSVIDHYFDESKFITHCKKVYISGNEMAIIQFLLLYMVRRSSLSGRIPKDMIDEYGMMLDEIYEEAIVKLNDPTKFIYSPTSTVYKATIETIEIIKKYVKDPNTTMKTPINMNVGMIGQSSSEASGGNKQFDAPTDTKRKNQGQKARESMKEAIERKYKDAIDKAKCESNKDGNNDNTNSVFEIFKGAIKEVGVQKSNETDKKRYEEIKSKLLQEINICKKIIIPNDKKIDLEIDKFHRNGQLISSHLAQAIQGVNCVYQRKVIKTLEDKSNPKYALVIAIDESGSMEFGSNVNPSLKSSEIATRLGIIYYEAIKEYPDVDIYVYGHGDDIVKYVTPKDNKPYRLVSRKIQTSQNEALSYNAIMKDVRLMTNKPVLFVNITDSGYLASQDSLIHIVESMNNMNATVSLLTITNKYTKKFDQCIMSFNNKIYGEDMWVALGSDMTIKDGLKKMSKIIKKMRDKFK